MTKRGFYYFFLIVTLSGSGIRLFSQTTYTWNQPGGGNWSTAANWTPSRNTPATNDILVINLGGTFKISGVPTQTVGKLRVSGNTAVTLEAVNSGTPTLTASTAAADAINVDAGSTLRISGYRQGGGNYGLTLTTANTPGIQASIDGTLVVQYGDSKFPATLGVFTKGGANAVLNFNAGSVYQHDVDGSTIPTANWNATSTCLLTALTSTVPAGLSQNFGNFTYDCPKHALLVNFNSALTSVAGNFTVKHAGYVQGPRTLNGLALSSNTNLALDIGGDLIVDNVSGDAAWLITTTGTANVTINVGGNFIMNNSGGSGYCFFDYKFGTTTFMGILVINVAGNLTITDSYLDMGYQASGYTVGTELRLSGNLSVSATGTLITSGANIVNGKIIFNKIGKQTIYEAAAGRMLYVNYQVNSSSVLELLSHVYLFDYSAIKGSQFTVLSGGILDANTFQIPSATGTTNALYNSFMLNAGAGIITANVNGVHQTGLAGPTISSFIKNKTFSSGADYTYDGTAPQVSGIFITTPVANQVRKLTVNNTAGPATNGLTLQQEIAVSDTCTFISGVITTTNVNVLTINDNAVIIGADTTALSTRYVNGPLKKIGNDAFVFPVGKMSHGCRTIGISAPGQVTDIFRAELIRGDAGALGNITAPGLQRVSGCEYWYLDRLNGVSNVDITLSWSGDSPCNAMSYVTALPFLTVAHFDGTNWNAHGNDGGYYGNAVAGNVTWKNVSTFSPFSLGSLLWWLNPLTVKFIYLNAMERDGQVKLDWSNVSESGVKQYIIEHSTDGRTFTRIGDKTARQNNSERADYSWWHVNPGSGINYYRIKAVEYTGEITHSSVALVNLDKTNTGFVVYPNPVSGNYISIAHAGLEPGQYQFRLLNMTGQLVMQTSFSHEGGAFSRTFELPRGISPGAYSLQIADNKIRFVKLIRVK